ncbi:ThiF family adenylyltransferase [Planctomycetota bacterium]|nr:ThiF family adenylyltransferase [Planctomycetota bacterium]
MKLEPGHLKALNEFYRVLRAAEGILTLEELQEPKASPFLKIVFTIAVGKIPHRSGGLKFMARETFVLAIHNNYPYVKPTIYVDHLRFARFPHVVWSHFLCLYQTTVEWNLSDGLYGYFDRLESWMQRASLNDMDPMDGPLEPPHGSTHPDSTPIVISADSPCSAGETWIGGGRTVDKGHYIEVDTWTAIESGFRKDQIYSFTLFLASPLPMEFPSNGGEFLSELEAQGVGREQVLRYLAISARLSKDDDPILILLGMPNRRSPSGKVLHHLAAWYIGAKDSQTLRLAVPKTGDNEELLSVRKELFDLLYEKFNLMPLKWSKIYENRPEIIESRDSGTPTDWLKGRKVLIAGCGALGSWIAEAVARSQPAKLTLVDNAKVAPGLLVRQNYSASDIALSKADALASRLNKVYLKSVSQSVFGDAYDYIESEECVKDPYDLVIDCTASESFQMRLERDWGANKKVLPAIASVVVDASASSTLVVCNRAGSQYGIASSYRLLKRKLSAELPVSTAMDNFYSDKGVERMFQPEPGCSDPTFRGSMADVVSLASVSIGKICTWLKSGEWSAGYYADLSHSQIPASENRKYMLDTCLDTDIGNYQVKISSRVIDEMKQSIQVNASSRGADIETGGLLLGNWNDATGVVWIDLASPPPKDSKHSEGGFECGTEDTLELHRKHLEQTSGATGYIGMWHTHPNSPPDESLIDVFGMVSMVSRDMHNQRKGVMMIVGTPNSKPEARVYLYESIMNEGEEEVHVMSSNIDITSVWNS